MARRSGFQKKIDSVHWTNFALFQASFAAGTAAILASAAQHLPETILRIRGELAIWPTSTGAPGRAAAIECGLILVPEGTGTTVLWSPGTDGDAPWIWWDSTLIAHEELVTDVVIAQNVISARKVVDSKAMRRVRNMELQFVMENTTLATGLSVDVALNARVLAGQS